LTLLLENPLANYKATTITRPAHYLLNLEDINNKIVSPYKYSTSSKETQLPLLQFANPPGQPVS